MAEPDPLERARERVNGLRADLEASTGRPVRLIETHISWLLLTDTLAYKLKKPVRLPFLDFTSLAARRQSAREELRVNQRLAPWLYIDTVDVVETAAGPRIDGVGRVVDMAVRMHRFPDDALWSERLPRGDVRAPDVEALAAKLAAFHASAPTAPTSSPYGRAQAHRRVAGQLAAALPRADVETEALGAWLQREVTRLEPHFEQRRANGHVRECHGDLHLANIVQIDGRVAPFDAIEFDAALRWIDPVQDIAFLGMDLLAHGEPGLAWGFMNAWLSESGDHEGLAALRFHLVCRALVRATVCALRERDGVPTGTTVTSTAYRALAASLAHPAPPRLAITHGLPGSGKTHVATRLAGRVGAVHVRSDIERKRLFGVAPLERTQGIAGVYEADATERTYARLRDLARGTLLAGWPVVVDAAFLRRDERASFAALAAERGVAFTIVDCAAPMALLSERVRARLARGGDASEADESVLARLEAAAEALDAGERAHALVVDATSADDDATLAQRWLQASA